MMKTHRLTQIDVVPLVELISADNDREHLLRVEGSLQNLMALSCALFLLGSLWTLETSLAPGVFTQVREISTGTAASARGVGCEATQRVSKLATLSSFGEKRLSQSRWCRQVAKNVPCCIK